MAGIHLRIKLGLPYIRHFPEMSGIAVLFVSGNNFLKCSNVRNFDRFRGSYHYRLWKTWI